MLYLIILLARLSPQLEASVIAHHDPITNATIKTQSALMETHNKVMQTQVMKDAVYLKNSYLEAKKYYDMVDERSKHAGGLAGYYKDYFESQLSNSAAAEWRRLNLEANSQTGQGAVGSLVTGVAENINKRVDRGIDWAAGGVTSGLQAADLGYSGVRSSLFTRSKVQTEAVDKVLAESEKRADKTAEQIKDLVQRGSKPLGVSQKERESIEMQASLLQLQQLAEIRQLLNVNAQILNAQAKQQLAEAAVALRMSQDLSTYREDTSRRRLKAGAKTDAIVRELRRRPGE